MCGFYLFLSLQGLKHDLSGNKKHPIKRRFSLIGYFNLSSLTCCKIVSRIFMTVSLAIFSWTSVDADILPLLSVYTLIVNTLYILLFLGIKIKLLSLDRVVLPLRQCLVLDLAQMR
jgi:hypothetical protein